MYTEYLAVLRSLIGAPGSLIESVSTFVLGGVLGSKKGSQKKGKNRVSLVDKRT